VVIVSVEVAPLGLGVTGVVEKLLALQAGSGEPVPVTAQARLTGALYAFRAVSVTVEVPLLPGATAAGVVADILKSGTVAGP
jgi:hypothetical protein